MLSEKKWLALGLALLTSTGAPARTLPNQAPTAQEANPVASPQASAPAQTTPSQGPMAEDANPGASPQASAPAT